MLPGDLVRSLGSGLGATFVLTMGLGCSSSPSRPQPASPPVATRDASPSATPPATGGPLAFAYVRTGRDPFPDPFPRAGLWLLWHLIDVRHKETEAFVLPDDTPVHPDMRASIAALAAADPDFEPPPSHVWLIGPRTVCRATVDSLAWIDLHTEGTLAAAVTFALTGCDGSDWAPLAAFGEDVHVGALSWRAARSIADLVPESPPLAAPIDPVIAHWLAKIEALRGELGSGRPRLELATVATQPLVVDAAYGLIAPADVPCDAESIEHTELGLYSDGAFEPLVCERPFDLACDDRWLVGALVSGNAPAALVLMDGMYGVELVLPPSSELRLVDERRSWPTGVYHDEDRLSRRFVDPCDGP